MATYDNATTVGQLNGLYKEVYGDEGIQDLVPESSKLQKLIPFKSGVSSLGNQYNVPVVLSLENGITFGGTAGNAFALNPPISMNMADAKVNSCDHVIRSLISYGAAARATGGGPAAFANATSLMMKSELESMSRVIEIEMLYGQAATGLGLVATVNSITSTTMTFTFGQAEWAAGIWSGSKNLLLDLINVSGNTVVNSNASLSVIGVNVGTKTITVSGNSTDITAITTLYGASGSAYVTWFGSEGLLFVGLNNIFQNTTGTLFGINAATNELWQGNVFNVNGNLSFDVLGSGLANAQARGLDEDIDVFVSPISWRYLNASANTAQRVFDKSYDSAQVDVGSKTIKYFTQSGVVTIHSHIYVKQGEAYAFPSQRVIRVGACPVGFKDPTGVMGDEVFLQAPNNAGVEFRAYGNEAILPLKPAVCTLFTGITNT